MEAHMPDPVAAGYDLVHEAMARSPLVRRLWRAHACGEDFPGDLWHISFVTVPEMRRIAGAMRLRAGGTLVDIGCGAGGPALWLARETGASVIGVDASAAGPAVASQRAAALGFGERARFITGTFDATGLPDACADAVTSNDALQYAPDKAAAFREMKRLLRPGGRLVVTAFELEPSRVAGMPVWGADPVADYRPPLEAAGFMLDEYDEVPGWPEPMTSAYRALEAHRDALAAEMGESAVAALMSEANATLAVLPYRRRVLFTATA
jgi:SAM-dependent methyltransferase